MPITLSPEAGGRIIVDGYNEHCGRAMARLTLYVIEGNHAVHLILTPNEVEALVALMDPIRKATDD